LTKGSPNVDDNDVVVVRNCSSCTNLYSVLPRFCHGISRDVIALFLLAVNVVVPVVSKFLHEFLRCIQCTAATPQSSADSAAVNPLLRVKAGLWPMPHCERQGISKSRELHLELCNSVSTQKHYIMTLTDDGESLTICAFIWIQYQSVTDGQTDGFAKTISRSTCTSMPTRDKNTT